MAGVDEVRIFALGSSASAAVNVAVEFRGMHFEARVGSDARAFLRSFSGHLRPDERDEVERRVLELFEAMK